jgi:hypothetical protein
MSTFESVRRVKILDFDIENRPLSYWYADRPTAEVTAIAWGWAGDPDTITVRQLGIHDTSFMLSEFVGAYNEADIVTGHYIRKHDLPILNGALIEAGWGPLSPKLTIDTRLDLTVLGDIPATQEHLAEMFGIELPKVHMTQSMWREANRLTRDGLRATESRVKGDVMQHMALRTGLSNRGVLGAPKTWRA